ncbi:MAG: hypothetical protein LBT59_03860 [Clostridiales bacterium]|jgi:hypothetical protein|nr:hypothetical protein [Clostridiales bacterium]
MRSIKLLAAVAALAMLAACSSLDVVANQAGKSFDALIEAAGSEKRDAGWAIKSPDGQASFIWAKSGSDDALLEIDIQPFLDAGLDPSLLPSNYTVSGGVFTIEIPKSDASSADAPEKAFKNIILNHRTSIGYHPDMDHFNIELGGGNLFEWAKDMLVLTDTDTNQEKDAVFALNPEPFKNAGVNLEAVDGWAHAEVPVHVDGVSTLVWKLLKPFNLL